MLLARGILNPSLHYLRISISFIQLDNRRKTFKDLINIRHQNNRRWGKLIYARFSIEHQLYNFFRSLKIAIQSNICQ